MPERTSPQAKPRFKRRRNGIALSVAIILTVIGVPSLAGVVITVVSGLADGSVNVFSGMGRLIGIALFAAVIVWLYRLGWGKLEPVAAEKPFVDFRGLTPGSPEYQAALEDYRQRRDKLIADSARVAGGMPTLEPDTSGFLRSRSREEAESDMALSAADYRESLRPSLRKWPVALQGPYLALGFLAWGGVICAALLAFWGSSPGMGGADALMGLLCLPLWILAVGSSSRILDGSPSHQNVAQKVSYGILRKTWTTPAVTWILVLGFLALGIAAMLALAYWHPSARPGLGAVEVLMASFVGWGSALALVFLFWSVRPGKKKS
ncbi:MULTISPECIES: hypothetical protein [Arthrobacter]|uniref:Uncharacterized protein n=2 Tax=Arthrobacter TaxID=1663 RepID=A0ABU9KN27_9MICC|nr:hypothetical protein [Arthrobacter sp. YJM1]MDP5228252.1 hypothetical protein [Arthrobacter sp. YJM1]